MYEDMGDVQLTHQGITWWPRMNMLTTYMNVVDFAFFQLFSYLHTAVHPPQRVDTRIQICILMDVIVPNLEYAGETWEGNAKLVKQLE